MKKLRTMVALLVLLSFMCTAVISSGIPLQPCYGNTLSAAEMAARAIDFINTKYKSGENIDGYAAYVLTLAGEDLATDKWTVDNKSLKERIKILASLLGDSNSLITYIISTQNDDDSFGPNKNKFHTTAATLQALAAVKADTVGTVVYDQVRNSIDLAISYFKSGYQSGSMPYVANGGDFDYRCVEALVAAGENISSDSWTREGTSLKEEVITSADAATAAAAAKSPAKDAVASLAKELTVLLAVYPASDSVNKLADAIIASKDDSVSGQLYFGQNIYDDVLVLTALGKAGRLGDIDQSQALAYLNTFKTDHYNSWSMPAGAAWRGVFSQEEPDLTAQVLTALSYFNGAKNPGHPVYNLIQEGLDYLSDIQDPDTEAITAMWDSTFATAETLIALKSLGKTYNEYAGTSSPWMKRSKTKTIAQCLLALSRWDDSAVLRDQLADMLAGRQKYTEPGKGSFENSVYSDMWAFIGMGEAGKLDKLDTAGAKDYILSKQGADGSWGEIFENDYYPDVLSTTQAIRALTYLPDASCQQVQAAINGGLTYLKKLQQADGGVYSAWYDPAVDNSELIVTLYRLNKDPSANEWKNLEGLTPVDYLLNNTMNDDGSFGTVKNVFGSAEALSALILVNGYGNPGGENNQPPPVQNSYSVNIAVVGMNGEHLYEPGIVTVSTDGQWGCTALGALHATGLSYHADPNTGFVSNIEGQANSGMNGWMFKVNGVVPAVSGKDKKVSEGDQIIWWYSKDINSSGPDWSSLTKSTNETTTSTKTFENMPPGLQTTKGALEALENLGKLLAIGTDAVKLDTLGERPAVVVVKTGELPDMSAFLALQKNLASNTVDLAIKAEATKDNVIADTLGETGLFIPKDALSNDLTVSIKKQSAGFSGGNTGSRTPPAGYWQVAPVYSLGPDGIRFAVPATLVLKVAVPPLARPENLVLAQYDQAEKKWCAIPAVFDAGSGLIMAKISHFSDYTVLARQERKSFDDVNPAACGWAVEPVELLAGAGIIEGVGGRLFEPDRPITRAELSNILVRALNLPAACPDNSFKDVAETEWYAGCVAAAACAELLRGYEDGFFRPEKAIPREEMAAVLARLLNKGDQPNAGLPFTDAGEISPWAAGSLAAVVSEGLLKGYPDGTCKPQNAVTRAECAAMVYRALTSY